MPPWGPGTHFACRGPAPFKIVPFLKLFPNLLFLGIILFMKETLAIAESCTGGLVSSLITNVSGSSKYFKGGIVAYSNDIKVSMLGVSKETIKKHGAVSRQAAQEMAKGIREVLASDVGAAITGIAGPKGGTKEKPVGLAYMAVATSRKVKTKKVLFKGTRLEIKEKFAVALLKLIEENA